MTRHPAWWNGSVVGVICIILAAKVASIVIHTPNTNGGLVFTGAVIIVLALAFRAAFQLFMNKRKRLKRDKSHKSDVA